MTKAELKLDLIRMVLDCEDQELLLYVKQFFEVYFEEPDLPAEAISASISAESDNDLSDSIPLEEAFKSFRNH